MKSYINCDVFNIGGVNTNIPAGRAWQYWADGKVNNHFGTWLKNEYKLDLIRRKDGLWELSGDERDCMMFILRWS